MAFSTDLLQELSPLHLLKHPFYQAWVKGELPLESLGTYARQYFQHVKEFPRYLSATHSNCEEISQRQVLLENLISEEQGERNHPELWLRFAEGVGATRESVLNEIPNEATKDLIDTFFQFSRSSYAEGLGALFAYENQIPEVAATKIEGLIKHYNITDERTLEFFKVHLEADKWHSQVTAELIDSLDDIQKERARRAARTIAEKMWSLLSGVYSHVC